MKFNYVLCLSLAAWLSSCEQNEDIVLSEQANKEIVQKTLSGSFNLSELPKTVDFNGIKIEFTSDSTVFDKKQTRSTSAAEPKWVGPFYVSGTPNKVYNDLQKVSIHTEDYLNTGIYMCQIWNTNGKIILPSNAIVGQVLTPNPSGYKKWSNQEKGVNWSMSSTENGVELSWNFYTIVIAYDMAGRQINRTIPMDGAKIKVPYQYMVVE